MSSAPPSPLAPEDIARDAHWLIQALDPNEGVVRMVEMDREAYRSASFLDDRMLQEPRNRMPAPWALAEQAAAAIDRSDARWIFHISHVGSTLLARMLGEIPGVLSVREPRFFRDLLAIPATARAQYIPSAQRLFSRTFAANEVALVKTTSTVSEIAAELMPPGARALFMYVDAKVFLPTILAGEHSMQEMQHRAGERAQRLKARGIELPQPRNYTDLVAAAWACEMTSLEAAAQAVPDRKIGWIDFDRMLQDVPATLASSAKLFGFEASQEQLAAIATGPLLGRYSKAPEHEYSPGLRQRVIHQAIVRHEREIYGALAMLNAAAEKSPLLARALARSGES